MSDLIRYRVVNTNTGSTVGEYFTLSTCKAMITKETKRRWGSTFKKEDFQIVEYELVERRRTDSTNNFSFDEKDAPLAEKPKDIWD